MALLENLKPGHIYVVKVSASNNVGDGPFSSVVELSMRADLSSGRDPRLSGGSTYSTGEFVLRCRSFCLRLMELLISRILICNLLHHPGQVFQMASTIWTRSR